MNTPGTKNASRARTGVQDRIALWLPSPESLATTRGAKLTARTDQHRQEKYAISGLSSPCPRARSFSTYSENDL